MTTQANPESSKASAVRHVPELRASRGRHLGDSLNPVRLFFRWPPQCVDCEVSGEFSVAFQFHLLQDPSAVLRHRLVGDAKFGVPE